MIVGNTGSGTSPDEAALVIHDRQRKVLSIDIRVCFVAIGNGNDVSGDLHGDDVLAYNCTWRRQPRFIIVDRPDAPVRVVFTKGRFRRIRQRKALCNLGPNRVILVARMPMMATTIMSSISVNPCISFFIVGSSNQSSSCISRPSPAADCRGRQSLWSGDRCCDSLL